MSATTLASLGMSCQSAHQLSTYAETSDGGLVFTKGPFDWLICPPESLTSWLDEGLPDFDRSELSIHRDHVWWNRFQFWFWHGFYTKSGGEKYLDLDACFERELSKLKYQRNQFRGLNPANTIFVVSNSQNNLTTDVFEKNEAEKYTFSSEKIARLQESLDRFFATSTQMIIVSRPDRIEDALRERENVYLLPAESSEWKGCELDWAKILDNIK